MLKGDKVNFTYTIVVNGARRTSTHKGFTVDCVNPDNTVRILYPDGFTVGYAHVTELTRV